MPIVEVMIAVLSAREKNWKMCRFWVRARKNEGRVCFARCSMRSLEAHRL